MAKAKTCFVAMGFGRKTDYQSGRVLDLDKSYQYIIKPAAEAAGLECRRADEIAYSGTIDVSIYEQLLNADVVIVDISTSNANAFYELGVRHALRPGTTITIAEDKMVAPFDISHLAIRKYCHLGEGIDFGEVVRMRSELTESIETILKNPQKDSPVYTFFSDLEPPVRRKIEESVAQSAPRFFAGAGYGIGMHEHMLDMSAVLSVDEQNRISIADPKVERAASAGYIAVNLSKGRFSVLKDIVTFDEDGWRLLITLVQHFGIDASALGEAILSCPDPVLFRLLAKLAGELRLSECVKPLCLACLKDLKDLATEFGELRLEYITPIVPPKYSDRSVILEVDQLSSALLASAATPVRCAGRSHLAVQVLGPAATGKPRLTATTRGPTSFGSPTAEANARRPNLLGLAPAPVGRLEIGPADRESRHSHRLASPGFSFVLDVANPPWQAGSPQGAARDSRSDPEAEPQ
jgi:hypothetical protein